MTSIIKVPPELIREFCAEFARVGVPTEDWRDLFSAMIAHSMAVNLAWLKQKSKSEIQAKMDAGSAEIDWMALEARLEKEARKEQGGGA